MKKKQFEIGELVSVKDYVIKHEFVFVWDIVNKGMEEWLIINLPTKAIDYLNLKRVTDKKQYKLFSTYEYAYIKQYKLLSRNISDLERDYSFLKEIIEIRGEYNFSAELIFLYVLQSLVDKKEIETELIPDLIESISADEYFVLKTQNHFDTQLIEKAKQLFEAIKKQLELLGCMFWLIKKAKNFSMIADKIITDDGRSMLQRLKEDRALLESLLVLFKKREHYKSATYSPTNTKKDKPLSHKLNQSFFGTFAPEVENYSKLLEENKSWEDSMDSTQAGFIGAEGMVENLLSGKFSLMQQLFFSNLGGELPIRKIVNGVDSIDYKLEFYIPIFKWMMPDIFRDKVGKLDAPNLRKYHLRKIKNFIAGKI